MDKSQKPYCRWLGKKRLMLLILCSLGVVFGNGVSTRAWAEDIAIIVSGDLSVYQMALDGFRESCQCTVKKYFITQQDEGSIEDVLSQIKKSNPKLIFAIGKISANLANSNFSELPIIFSLVPNPEQYNLYGKNIYGVRLDVNPKSQIDYLRKIFPKVRNIGILYNAQRSQEIIDSIRKEASNLNIGIVAVNVSSNSQIAEAISSLEGKIDSFWLITDSTVANNVVFERLLIFTLSNKIPLLCPARAFVDKGGLFALDVDFRDLGAQAAQIANELLGVASGKVSIEENKIQWPRKVKLILNTKVANTIGLSIPQSIMQEADQIIENSYNKK